MGYVVKISVIFCGKFQDGVESFGSACLTKAPNRVVMRPVDDMKGKRASERSAVDDAIRRLYTRCYKSKRK